MSGTEKKKVLLNLEPTLYKDMKRDAEKRMLTVNEWLRGAIRLKLGHDIAGDMIPIQPRIDEMTPARDYPIESVNAKALAPLWEPAASVAEQCIHSSDKSTREQWLELIRQWAKMDGNIARTELLEATGGVMPPSHLFVSASDLADWLMEHGK